MREAAPLRIRRATRADAAALAAFAARAFRATYGPDADPATGGGSRAEDVEAYVTTHFGPAQQEAELAGATLVTFVADADGAEPGSGGTLAAYAQLALPAAPGGDAELARLYVDAWWHGRGVAGLLLAAVVEAARAAGAGQLRLAVYQRNVRAVAFYRRQEFEVAGTGRFRMGAEVQDDWLMVRPLS